VVDLKLEDEPGRLAALQRYELLDTPREAPFDRITGLVQAVLQVPIATISLIDANRQWLKSCVGLDATETTREVSFCTHTIKGRAPMYVPDAKRDPRFANNPLVTGPPFIGSYLGVPLETPDGYNLGALCAIDSKPRTYTPQQIEVLKSFAALVTDEIELRQLAHIDHLTGAATRRGFCLELEKAISRFGRHVRSSALVVFDIDRFKLVNDTYGHPAGDTVLTGVGAKVAGLLRTSDVLGRLGGEEFGILVADADEAEAMQAAERFRGALEALTIEHDPPLRVTASFGVALLDAECLSPQQWLARADQGMYAAKRSGRNKVCLGESLPA
jgi:diguanylate cyclase (GGDEF)-like protein